MKTFILIVFILQNLLVNSQTISKYPKEKEEELVLKIREKYQLINRKKNSYQKEENYWSYESELPDSENENNEEGNEEITNTIYLDNAQKRLHVYSQYLYKYQVPYNKLYYYEGYFWDGKLIFIYSRIEESLNGPDYGMLEFITDLKEGTRASEKRIYINDDNIFRILEKHIQFTGNLNIDSIFNVTPNTYLDVDSLPGDLYLIDEYDIFINY